MLDIIFLLAAAIEAATPLLLAVLGETITEKSGHLNLGVEGLMLMGAVSGFYVCFVSQDVALALLAAAIAGIIGSLIYAVLTVTLRANQVVTGLALTIFGTGFSSFLGSGLIGKVLPDNIRLMFKPLNIWVLSDIPIIGQILFRHNFLVYAAIILAVLVGIYIYKTKYGLNLRAVGENPASADASGIKVTLYKYVHILLGGALCALGGAYLSVVRIPAWQDNVTAGRGWIAVALVIVAGWNPYKAIGAVILFGALDIMGLYLQKFNIPVSQYLINMLPYAVTILALVLISSRKSRENNAPAALGMAYFREDR